MSTIHQTFWIAFYAAILSTATAALQIYQAYRKRRRYDVIFQHYPVKINTSDNFIQDYAITAVVLNRSESDLTIFDCTFQFGNKKSKGSVIGMEPYGRDEGIELPFVVKAMSAATLYNFARHWARSGINDELSEKSPQMFLRIQAVGEKDCRIIPIKGARDALISFRNG